MQANEKEKYVMKLGKHPKFPLTIDSQRKMILVDGNSFD